jgi:hypothetical protein
LDVDTGDVARSRAAHELLAPLRPSKEEIDTFIIHTLAYERAQPSTAPVSSALGHFASAGYQLLDGDTVVYALHTPDLAALGMRLRGKHLIIDGVVGDLAGKDLSGDLTINGTAGSYAGYRMVGHMTVNGAVGSDPGFAMYGEYADTRDCGVYEDEYDMVGKITLGKNPPHWRMRSTLFVPSFYCRFLKEVRNPRGLEFNDLRRQLEMRYGIPSRYS